MTLLDDDLRAAPAAILIGRSVGMYQPAATAQVEVKAEARASSGDLSTEQLLELFRGNEQHLPPGVRRRLEAKGIVAADGG